MHRYTAEQKEFIREIAPGRYNVEIADLFNTKFGADVTESQIKSYKANHKIQSNVVRKCGSYPTRLFTAAQEEFIFANAKNTGNVELTQLINSHFGFSITVKQIRTWKKNHNCSSDLTGQFNKGHVPINKGTKGLYNVGGNETSFKKGDRPANYKPVGSERIDRDGYVLVKVQDDGPWHKRWRHKHKVIWEKAHGPIPRGHAVLFADQNRLNSSLDNLILIPQSKLSILNKKGLLHKHAELTRTGIAIADVYQKISRIKKKNKKMKGAKA